MTNPVEFSKRRAGVWQRGGRLFVETHVHPPPGGRVTADQPRFFKEISEDETVENIGMSVIDALEANSVDKELDYPTDILDTVHAAGVKSYGAFTRGAKRVPVSVEDGRVRVGPSDGAKHAGSFIGTGEDVFSASLSPEDVGRAVLEALERSVARPSR